MFSEAAHSVPLLGALCVAEGLLSQMQLDECLQLQTSCPTTPIGQIFCQQDYLSEEDLSRMLTQQRAFRRALVERVERQLPSRESVIPHERDTPRLHWEPLADDYRTQVRTVFATLQVCVDQSHTSLLADMRFCARVEMINGSELASTDDLVSLSAARAWCEMRYAELLRNELESVGGRHC